MVAGESRHASPLIRDGVFGESYVEAVEPLDDDQALEAAETVRVRLEMATSLDPMTRVPLVEGEWSADQLVGRQLLVSTTPTMAVADLLQSTFRQIPSYVPSLAVQALDQPTPPESLGFVGDAFTPSGTRMVVEDDGRVLVEGQTIHDPDGPSGDPAAVTSVASLEADAGGFEQVRLRFRAEDASGAVVPHLTAGDFRVLEDGTPVPFVLRANQADPRVLVMIDQSLSMADAWYGTEAVTAFLDELRADLLAVHPGAIVTASERMDSNLWENLAAAAHRSASVIVYVTDGDVRDEATPEWRTGSRAVLPPSWSTSEAGPGATTRSWWRWRR